MSFNYHGSELTSEQLVRGYIHLIVKELFKKAKGYKAQIRKHANKQLEKVAGTSSFWKSSAAADMYRVSFEDTLSSLNELNKTYSFMEKIDIDDRYKFMKRYEEVLDDFIAMFGTSTLTQENMESEQE